MDNTSLIGRVRSYIFQVKAYVFVVFIPLIYFPFSVLVAQFA